MGDSIERWTADFGRQCTDGNRLSRDDLDSLRLRRYGISPNTFNQEFLWSLQFGSVLKLGCNLGQQLRRPRTQTGASFSGVDAQPRDLEADQRSVPDATSLQTDGRNPPFADSSFDLVFTSAMLSHVSPEDIPRAIGGIHRVARRYIWGLEYFPPTTVWVPRRSHGRLLWKTEFAAAYRDVHPDSRLLRKRRLPCRNEPLVDTMFLLERS